MSLQSIPVNSIVVSGTANGLRNRGDPMVSLLLLIGTTTGLIDAVSVLGLGHVFTANMTGNVVLLGFAFAGTPGFSWNYCAAALLAFLVGAAAGGRLFRAAGGSRRRWLLIVASSETTLLLGAAIVLLVPASESCLLATIMLTAVAMGIRNATVRQLDIPDLTTTVLTTTLTGIAADARWAGGDSLNADRRLLSLAAIILGVFLGALLVRVAGPVLPLLVAAGGTMVSTIVLARDLPAS